MTQEQFNEGNKLIAEFLGWELSTRGRKFKRNLPPYGYVKAHPNYLKFHISLDWLILAVEKIKELTQFKTIDECSQEEWEVAIGVTRLSITTDTLIIWMAVIQFAKWHKKRRFEKFITMIRR